MALRFPQGSVSSLISLAAGAITASAVALAWLPLLTESAQRELTNEAHHMHTLVRLAQSEVQQHPAGSLAEQQALAEFQTTSSVDAIWLADVDGTILYSVPTKARPTVDVGARIRELCARPSVADKAGLGETIAFMTDAAALRASCLPTLDEHTPRFLVVLAQNDTWAPLARSRSHATNKLIFLGAVVALIVILGIRWLLAPIQKISMAAGQIARGEREVRVAVRGPEEIAELARAVNALASSVEAREDEIRGRMEVVNEISSMVAHEIRNPLQSLELLTTLARTEPDPATRDNLLTTMEQEIRTLEGVVQRVLRSSGPLRIAPAASDLVAIVHRAATMAEPDARRRKVALLVQAPGALEARVDGSLVRRAFENLLHNAIEFAGQNPPGQVTASLTRHGNLVRMLVDDDGPGVSDSEIARIFQPYYSSKSGGIGLGLALCKQVFDAHGGSIRYETSPLGGARFVAELPMEAVSAPSAIEKGSRA
ncbi:MAG TPA: hypothetical protein DFR83_25520 [Deltaproteobacteria bacterium]|nr:hypothetical protein [Deltaproteobacteria bacterium]